MAGAKRPLPALQAQAVIGFWGDRMRGNQNRRATVIDGQAARAKAPFVLPPGGTQTETGRLCSAMPALDHFGPAAGLAAAH